MSVPLPVTASSLSIAGAVGKQFRAAIAVLGLSGGRIYRTAKLYCPVILRQGPRYAAGAASWPKKGLTQRPVYGILMSNTGMRLVPATEFDSILPGAAIFEKLANSSAWSLDSSTKTPFGRRPTGSYATPTRSGCTVRGRDSRRKMLAGRKLWAGLAAGICATPKKALRVALRRTCGRVGAQRRGRCHRRNSIKSRYSVRSASTYSTRRAGRRR